MQRETVFFLGAWWEGDVWVECEGWKDSLQQDSHPLEALVFPSVEQFSPKPERRKEEEKKQEGKREIWMDDRTPLQR